MLNQLCRVQSLNFQFLTVSHLHMSLTITMIQHEQRLPSPKVCIDLDLACVVFTFSFVCLQKWLTIHIQNTVKCTMHKYIAQPLQKTKSNPYFSLLCFCDFLPSVTDTIFAFEFGLGAYVLEDLGIHAATESSIENLDICLYRSGLN